MLADPVFADYLEAYGRGGQRAMAHDALKYLGRLYWYTVEFGLVAESDGLRIYGSGIVSSSAESRFALDDPSPHRLKFDLARVMRTDYRIDDFQQNYFVIPSFDELLRVTIETDFAPLYEELKQQPDIAVAEIVDEAEVITRGTQEYASRASKS
jgi:phenylalanine-4-hydroxylase